MIILERGMRTRRRGMKEEIGVAIGEDEEYEEETGK